MKIRLCAIAKDESIYLPRWIHHHLFFGFDEIFIFVNGSTDNSIELMSRISDAYNNVFFRNGDELLEKCVKEGKNFQVEAYSLMYQDAKADNVDFIMFLDIDEFWTPKDFNTRINKLVENFGADSFDAFSFSWLFDVPSSERPILSDIYSTDTVMLRDRHVKTLLNMNAKLQRLSVHNHVIENGRYLLDSGVDFVQFDSAEQHHRSKVSEIYYKEKNNVVPDFFIYHTVYRSETEYLVSLMRGRKHASDNLLFKTNRWGYQFDKNMVILHLRFDPILIYDYMDSALRFVSSDAINEQVVIAKRNFIKRARNAHDVVISNSDERERFSKIFEGLSIV